MNELKINRYLKRLVFLVFDLFAIFSISMFSLWIQAENINFAIFDNNNYWSVIFLVPFIFVIIFNLNGIYNNNARDLSFQFFYRAFQSVIIAIIIWAGILYLFNLSYPKVAILTTSSFILVYLFFTRLSTKWFFATKNIDKDNKVIIFGAGESARQLLDILHKSSLYKVIAMIDDDPSLQKNKVEGVQIYSRDELKKLINDYEVSEIFLAIASLKFSQKKLILNWLKTFNIKVRLLPPVNEILEGKVTFSYVRKVTIEDILGRDEVTPNPNLLAKCIKNKVVLITGAGGSIGSELAKQVLAESPAQLILFEQSEFALYKIEKELKKLNSKIKLVALLGSVLDKSRLSDIFKQFKPSTIYHAAAYKHVPLVEKNIKEGFNTNTFGTYNLAKIAAENKVQYFLLVSTDKAVRPTNFMGASKRLAEMILQALQKENPNTIFAIVRFGNVLDSSGSVVPLFREQIKSGGPVTVTHREVTRYFMTISEAVSLIIQATAMSKGGEVFVLEMGKSIKISNLAKKMISLSGFQVAKNSNDYGIQIKYTGLRAGEKLLEELLIGDNVASTEHPRILKVFEKYLFHSELKKELNLLEINLFTNNYKKLNTQLKNLVSGFNHNGEIVDCLKK